MARKRFSVEQIIAMLREVEVLIGQGQTVGMVEHPGTDLLPLANEYGGLKLDQARRFRDLERENQRLGRALSELTLDMQIMKEALDGTHRAASR